MGTATAMSLPRMTLPTLRSLGCSLCPVASSVTLSRYTAFLFFFHSYLGCNLTQCGNFINQFRVTGLLWVTSYTPIQRDGSADDSPLVALHTISMISFHL